MTSRPAMHTPHWRAIPHSPGRRDTTTSEEEVLDMNDLKNRVALVTGASRGIGRASAKALAEAGARLLVHYGRAVDEAHSLVAEIRNEGGQAEALSADLATPRGAVDLAKSVREAVGERLDILVANAGISKAAAIEDHTIADFDALFATNVRGPFFLVKELLPVLTTGGEPVPRLEAPAKSVS